MFSILTPTFGQPEWLRLCVASVADQHGIVCEHIVQDGSCGSPPLLPDEVNSQYSLRYYAEKDKSMYDALNKAFSKSSGEIVGTLNSDEQFFPDVLLRVKEAFDSDPDLDVVYGDLVLIDSNLNPISYRRSVTPKRHHVRHFHLAVPPCVTFHRRRTLQGILHDLSNSIIADAFFAYEVMGRRPKTRVLPIPFAAFALIGTNLTHDPRRDMEASRWKNADSAWNRFLARLQQFDYYGRKILAGAMLKHDYSAWLYSPDSPSKRRLKEGKRLPFHWPQEINLTRELLK